MESITVFTPTYNRGYILNELYDSLKLQSSKNFIWLIIDDGSNDNTSQLVQKWIDENIIKIKYYKQNNMGKSMAYNRAIELARTELFTCVDSDDSLDVKAIEEIINCYNKKVNNTIIGIICFRFNKKSNTPITKFNDNLCIDDTLMNLYNNRGMSGDTMLIYKTNVIKKFRFPYFNDEKFVPESYLYDLIDKEGTLFVLRKYLYYGNYLNDGYTHNMKKIIAENPKGYEMFIKQRIKLDCNIKRRFLNSIRYIAICFVKKDSKIIKNSDYKIYSFLAYPFAKLYYNIEFKKYKNKNLGENNK